MTDVTSKLDLRELESVSGGSNIAYANRLTGALAADTANDTLTGALTGMLGGAGSTRAPPRKTA